MARLFTDRRGVIWSVGLVAMVLVVGATGLTAYLLNRPPSEATIVAGKNLFLHEFSPNDPLCGDGDGLGPVFNEKSCVACHFLGGAGGAGPNSKNVTSFEAFPVPGRPQTIAGGVHTFSVSKDQRETTELLAEHFPPFSFLLTTEYRGSCGPPRITTSREEFDPLQIEEINTPALFGLGEIEKISSAALSMNAARRTIGKIGKELGGDFKGTSVGRLHELGMGRFGKFGWKGQFATVEEFVANACAMELGLTNHKVAQAKPQAFAQDDSAKLDMSKEQLYQLVSFVRSLPAPQQVLPTKPKQKAHALRGEALFAEIGCTDCHVPEIGGVTGVYSDFQLYVVDKEEAVDDYVEPEFDPEFTLPFEHPRPAEWQTPPLWGVADSAPYFHDGSSPTLHAAILRHGRDGSFSRDKYKELPKQDQGAVIAFLMTLKAPQSRAAE